MREVDWMELGEVEGEEDSNRMYCMREEFIFNKRKKGSIHSVFCAYKNVN